jgi:hypothetical protein
MALIGPLSAEDSIVGFAFTQSYARIYVARLDTSVTLMTVNWYADQAAREANANPVRQKEFGTSTTSLTGDIFPAMYTWLKTQPDFAGYVDG